MSFNIPSALAYSSVSLKLDKILTTFENSIRLSLMLDWWNDGSFSFISLLNRILTVLSEEKKIKFYV